MANNEQQRTLSYPIPNDSALEPPPEWARLGRQCPVASVTLPSGDPASLVTRYEDVRQVLSDPRFTRPTGADEDAAAIAENESGGVFNSEMSQALPQVGEGHRRWRRLTAKWFTAKRINALQPRIEGRTEQLIDNLLEHGKPANLKATLGFPLPVWVICEILGVPEADRQRFSYWSDTLLNLTRYRQEEIETAQAEFFSYMAAHVAARRADPGDDLLSELTLQADAEGHGMTDAMLIATGQGLLVAGHETTANMISKMMAMLLADRSRWQQLVDDRSLVRTAVEESLRFDANAGFGMLRYLTDEMELGGTTLPRGTTVVCSMASANRDEDAFADADRMDLARSPNPHLAFGSGAHSCLGQALARTELQTVLEVLLRRLPTLDLAVAPNELRRLEGLVVGGLDELLVTW